ncbi:hypothetical protein SGPA1_30072 [Streptomyces misionensis JCM 4497]
MPGRLGLPLRAAQLPALRGRLRTDPAPGRRPGHPRPARRLLLPDRRARGRGHLPGPRHRPDQPRLRELHGEARGARRQGRAAGQGARLTPEQTANRAAPLGSRGAALLASSALRGAARRAAPRGAREAARSATTGPRPPADPRADGAPADRSRTAERLRAYLPLAASLSLEPAVTFTL